MVEVRVDLVFPDNEVKSARVNVSAHRRSDPHDTEASPSVPIAKYMEPVWNALRALGGVASAASASVRVTCALDGGGSVLGAPPPEKPETLDKPDEPPRRRRPRP